MNSNKKIAVVGLACRFPGADNIDEFWKLLCEGRDTITHFSHEELEKHEFDYDKLRNNPDYVGAKGVLNDIDKFDAAFFGYTPKEAETLDPQYRLWLETVWNALENAGCDPYGYKGRIGVFAGGSMNTYLLNNILRTPRVYENFIRMRTPEAFQTMIGNDVAFLPTKTAYKLNLRGPAINVQSACSTSLVAVSLACNSLVNGESDMCIAGGVTIIVPQETGYLYQEGAIPSPDGVCRSFDKDAKGTVFSNGVGVAVLKRLDDAVRDGDIIYSVVNGWALNNDGGNKLSYVAPAVEGQTEVIMSAQSFAGVSPEDISYIEAHGTATLLGDPIELTALSNAFRAGTDKRQYCGIGSVKSNMGHSDTAAGIAGFIKASLAAYYKTLPKTIHFSEPNPYFDFDESPFFVQTETRKWDEHKPLMIGVSAFGIGGTNAHVIISEPPIRQKSESVSSDLPDMLVLSAKSEKALARRKQDLKDFLKSHPDEAIKDVTFSLATGRHHMKFRCFASIPGDKKSPYEDIKFTDGKTDDFISRIAFMFPGQGAQYISMGKGLYHSNSLFREISDECFSIFKSETGEELKEIIFSDPDDEKAAERLADTEITQPALFIIEYALARVFMKLDITPSYLIGHSIGEYTAACLSGVFDMKSALKIVIMRGRLMQKMPRGKMMAVRAERGRLDNIKGGLFEVAAENASQACTISFKPEKASAVENVLKDNDIQYIALNTSHAFHSSDFDPILNDFSSYVSQFTLSVPRIPFISCLTGSFITEEQATSPNYWAQQLRNTVLFKNGISAIAESDDVAFLEVGPNTHLNSLVRQHEGVANKNAVISSLGRPDNSDEQIKLLNAIGGLFNIGLPVNFNALHHGGNPSKVWLPQYPFEKTRCWIDFRLSDASYLNGIDDSRDSGISDAVGDMEDTSALSPAEKLTYKVLNLWRSVFGIAEIEADDNFFDIGGHSLMALQILTRIKEEYHQSISLKTFLDNPTVTGLCSLIKAEDVKVEKEPEPIAVTDLSHLPLSESQRRLWIVSRIDNLNPAYNVSSTYHFEGEIDPDIFRKSVEILFKKHFMMFSLFKISDGEPYCEIVPKPVNVEFLDYSEYSYDKSLEKLYSYASEDTRKMFDLENGPLYRLSLLKQNSSSYFFHATIHHLIFDGWSWSVFLHDLRDIYDAVINNRQVDLDELKPHYYSYIRRLQNNEVLHNEEELTKFWVDTLKGCPAQMNFPYDFPRREIPTGFGENDDFVIDAECTARLREISKRENATLFASALSAMGVLFQRYSGQNDICLGTHVATRPYSDMERIFGMFVNTIPVRLKVEKNTRFSSFVNHSKEVVLDAIAHQNLPFERIVKAINPGRASNINPLFQISIVWLYNSAQPIELAGIEGKHVNIKKGISPFDITFYLWESKDCIRGEIEYSTDLFKPETIARLKESYLTLINTLSLNPEVPLESISMVSEDEKNFIDSINNTKTDYPRDKTVVDLFEEQAALFPDKRAVVYKDDVLTYRQLNEKSNQLARTLRSKGVKSDMPVGLFVDKSVEMIVGVLAILKAGGAYLPIDPDYPLQRVEFILKESGCRLLLTQSKYMNSPLDNVTLIDLNSSSSYNPERSDIEKVNTPSDLAYFMYTSGTTGVPKGSMIPHYSVVRLVRNVNYMEMSSDDSILYTSAIVFDVTTYEIWGALLNGMTLFVADKETILDAAALGEELFRNKISILHLTSALFTQLAEKRTDIFSRLKYLLIGGDVLSASHINKVRRDNPQLKVINCYGPSENTTYSTTYLIDTTHETNIPIGKPVSNSTVYIFDQYMNYQPVGVMGELYVGGDGLSRGYLNREDLNSTKFTLNPYNTSERLYRTGDFGKWLPDGNIEFHGRVDNQIKIRGFRVELEEIESVLSEISGVIESVVKPVKVDEGDYRLVAFLNVPGSFKTDSLEINRQLKEKLPSYMIPSAYRFMQGFPKTINGKTDKKALNFDPNQFSLERREEKSELTPAEKIIHKIWCDSLKSNDILITDNFFDIGGTSLLAISVMSKIEAALNIELGLRIFFDSPRIGDLAESIELKRAKSAKKGGETNTSKESNSKIIKGEI